MFLEKNNYVEFLNIDVTHLCLPLYFFQSSVDPDDLSFGIKCFCFCIARFKFFDSQGRFMHVGRTPFGIQISRVASTSLESIFPAL